MDYYMIGQRIRKIRKAHGFSQEQLAEKVNISTTHMSHIETGNTKLSLPVLVDIATILDVKIDDILTDGHVANVSSFTEEITSILEACNMQEAKFLSEVVRTVKLSMDKYL